uniref:Uncharacterized LOC100179851 n=1 Tax=Ciona intestinalis TaxID=7719 RepID=F7AFS9_CIOIN|nr:uncharacterized protein LOC100179851 [Ciona intestinalis]|eukprot:XP_002129937.1 uncharacterized protein LOC100179851 [Ciona intestinalis]
MSVVTFPPMFRKLQNLRIKNRGWFYVVQVLLVTSVLLIIAQILERWFSVCMPISDSKEFQLELDKNKPDVAYQSGYLCLYIGWYSQCMRNTGDPLQCTNIDIGFPSRMGLCPVVIGAIILTLLYTCCVFTYLSIFDVSYTVYTYILARTAVISLILCSIFQFLQLYLFKSLQSMNTATLDEQRHFIFKKLFAVYSPELNISFYLTLIALVFTVHAFVCGAREFHTLYLAVLSNLKGSSRSKTTV